LETQHEFAASTATSALDANARSLQMVQTILATNSIWTVHAIRSTKNK